MRRLSALGGVAAVALATALAPATAHAAAPVGGGAHIAFARNGDIFLANATGTGITQLTKGPARDSQPVVRGTSVVFTRDGWVWTMTTSGANQQKRFEGHGASFAPANTSRVSYVANAGNGTCTWQEIRTQPLAARSTASVLASTAGNECIAGESPSDVYGPTTAWISSGVVYSDAHGGCCGGIADPDEVGIFNTGSSYILTGWITYGTPPAVSSSGSLVAFTSSLPTHRKAVHVYSVSATTNGKATQVGTDAGVQTPSFSPDGKYLLWTQGTKIREYSFATRKTITLIKNGGLSPSWG
jgi:hypothetical protein